MPVMSAACSGTNPRSTGDLDGEERTTGRIGGSSPSTVIPPARSSGTRPFSSLRDPLSPDARIGGWSSSRRRSPATHSSRRAGGSLARAAGRPVRRGMESVTSVSRDATQRRTLTQTFIIITGNTTGRTQMGKYMDLSAGRSSTWTSTCPSSRSGPGRITPGPKNLKSRPRPRPFANRGGGSPGSGRSRPPVPELAGRHDPLVRGDLRELTQGCGPDDGTGPGQNPGQTRRWLPTLPGSVAVLG